MSPICLLLAVLSPVAQVNHLSPAGFWQGLNLPDAKIVPSKAGTTADVEFGGLHYSISLSLAKGEQWVQDAFVNVSFVPGRKMSYQLISTWMKGRPDWTGEVDLDGTVRLEARFHNDPPARTGCTEFLWAVRQMAEQFGAKQGVAGSKIEEARVVDCLTQGDVFSLAKQWGWEHKGPWGGSGPTWAVPMDVHGQLVFISPSHPGRLEPWRLNLVAAVERPSSMSDAGWKSFARATRSGVAKDLETDQTVRFAASVDLRGGVTVHSIKQSIETFVSKVRLGKP